MPKSTTTYWGPSTCALPSPSAWIEDVAGWLTHNWDWFDPSHAHRVFWPDRPYKPDMDILVAGCGPSQAAVIAYNNPQASVVGIDISEPVLNQEIFLRHKHKLLNLEVRPLRPLAIEDVASLNRNFDLIIASGVLTHLDSPRTGLSALAKVLKPDGVAAITLPSPRLVDDPGAGFTVEGSLDLVEGAGLVFQDWFLKAPYYPPSLGSAAEELVTSIGNLPEREMWSVLEPLRNHSGQHLLTVCRPERPTGTYRIDFATPEAVDYVPLWRYRAGIDATRAFQPGWNTHLTPAHLGLAQQVDGDRSIRTIAACAAHPLGDAARFFQQLWRMDYLAIDSSRATP